LLANDAEQFVAHLSFRLSDPSITMAIGSTDQGWSASYKLTTSSWGDEVALTSGGDLTKLPGRLFLRVGEGDERGIGAIFHHEATETRDHFSPAQPEAFSVELVVTQEQIEALISSGQRGHPPTACGIAVEKITYGYTPDDKKWDNETDRLLPVQSIRFSFDNPDADEDDYPPEDEEDEDRSNASDAIIGAMEHIRRELRDYRRTMIGLTVILCFLIWVTRR
jgi:hypothetical protein